MDKVNIEELNKFVNDNIDIFHVSKIESLKKQSLKRLLKKKNPYLFKAKNLNTASDLVNDVLNASLFSSEEELLGKFLEELAVFISNRVSKGRKSSATGIDLEFANNDVHYVVSIKSGMNWGNSSQHKRQEEDFQTAVKVLKQSRAILNVQPVLGICYGKTRTAYLRGYLKVVGQSFWHLISGDQNLYTDIVEPLGYRAKEHNDKFEEEKSRVLNLFTKEFMEEYCVDGVIDWIKLVRFNSGNLTLQPIAVETEEEASKVEETSGE